MTYLDYIYLDNNASTRVDPRVLKAMLPFFENHYANPSSSIHAFGEFASNSIQTAKKTIADYFNIVNHDDIFFTSGATESNNLAIRGVIESSSKSHKHIITSAIEHDSVLAVCKYLQKHNVSVTFVPVTLNGFVVPNDIEAAICDDTVLISIMAANNEIGTIQPLGEIAAIASKYNIIFHSDATQYISTGFLDISKLKLDMVTFSSHKIYGPKGVGGLYVNTTTTRISSQILGGAQQSSIRSGTLNTPGIIGMGEAVKILSKESRQENIRIANLRNHLWESLSSLSDLTLNGSMDNRIPSNLNISINGVSALALSAEIPNILFSSGSACSDANGELSHVLKALGVNQDLIKCSIRLSLGRFSTDVEIETAIKFIVEGINTIRQREKVYNSIAVPQHTTCNSLL